MDQDAARTRLQQALDISPFQRWLGIRVDDVAADGLTIAVD